MRKVWAGGLVAAGAAAWLLFVSWELVMGAVVLLVGLGVWSVGREELRKRRIRDREPSNWAQVAENLTVGSELPVADAWDLVGDYQRRYPGIRPEKAYEQMRQDGL